MIDHQEQKSNLSLRNLLSQEDIDNATSVWTNNRVKKGKPYPATKNIEAVQKLALDLFLPVLESNHSLNFVMIDLLHDGTFVEYEKIAGNFTNTEMVGIHNAAINLTKRLHKVALRKRINSSPHVIHGTDEERVIPLDWRKSI